MEEILRDEGCINFVSILNTDKIYPVVISREIVISSNKYSIYSRYEELKVWKCKEGINISSFKTERFFLGEWPTVKKTKEFILRSGMISANTFTVISRNTCLSDTSKIISNLAIKEITRLLLNDKQKAVTQQHHSAKH